MIRGNEALIRTIAGRLRGASAGYRAWATSDLHSWLLATGRFVEAGEAGQEAWRAADEYRSVTLNYIVALRQTWLDMRQPGSRPELSNDAWKPVEDYLWNLPVFSTFSVAIRAEEPLARLVEAHESAQRDSESRYVREELQFARGCLALIRGEHEEARGLLEPLARTSNLMRRHRMLARVYAALGLEQEAATELEQALANPYLKWEGWDNYVVSAIQVLEQFRLAKLYDRLGNTDRARHWYEQFTEDWKDADPDIPELIEARERLAELKGEGGPTETADQ